MKKASSLIAVIAMLALGSLVALAPQAAPVRAFIQTAGVDAIVGVPSPDPTPDASPVLGAAPAPTPMTDPILVDSPTVDPTDVPAAVDYPVVNGAPCLPPGVVVDGNCEALPDSAPVATGDTTSAAPAAVAPAPTVNPVANQPGQGAPCLPPGVLIGTACVVPQPTPTVAPVPVPAPTVAPAPVPAPEPATAPTADPSPAA